MDDIEREYLNKLQRMVSSLETLTTGAGVSEAQVWLHIVGCVINKESGRIDDAVFIADTICGAFKSRFKYTKESQNGT